MKLLEKHPTLFSIVIGIYAFGALVFIGIAGFQVGVWFKNL
jgi:hypothetical protein